MRLNQHAADTIDTCVEGIIQGLKKHQLEKNVRLSYWLKHNKRRAWVAMCQFPEFYARAAKDKTYISLTFRDIVITHQNTAILCGDGGFDRQLHTDRGVIIIMEEDFEAAGFNVVFDKQSSETEELIHNERSRVVEI